MLSNPQCHAEESCGTETFSSWNTNCYITHKNILTFCKTDLDKSHRWRFPNCSTSLTHYWLFYENFWIKLFDEIILDSNILQLRVHYYCNTKLNTQFQSGDTNNFFINLQAITEASPILKKEVINPEARYIRGVQFYTTFGTKKNISFPAFEANKQIRQTPGNEIYQMLFVFSESLWISRKESTA